METQQKPRRTSEASPSDPLFKSVFITFELLKSFFLSCLFLFSVKTLGGEKKKSLLSHIIFFSPEKLLSHITE